MTDSWIAGGAAREMILGKEFTADVDVFFRTTETFEKWSTHFSQPNRPVKDTDYALTYTLPYGDNTIDVQLVHWNFWKDLEEVFSDFDITLTQFAWDGYNIYYTEEAIKALALNVIEVNNIKSGVGMIQRWIKYVNKGFNLPDETIQKGLQRIADDPSLIHRSWKGD